MDCGRVWLVTKSDHALDWRQLVKQLLMRQLQARLHRPKGNRFARGDLALAESFKESERFCVHGCFLSENLTA